MQIRTFLFWIALACISNLSLASSEPQEECAPSCIVIHASILSDLKALKNYMGESIRLQKDARSETNIAITNLDTNTAKWGGKTVLSLNQNQAKNESSYRTLQNLIYLILAIISTTFIGVAWLLTGRALDSKTATPPIEPPAETISSSAPHFLHLQDVKPAYTTLTKSVDPLGSGQEKKFGNSAQVDKEVFVPPLNLTVISAEIDRSISSQLASFMSLRN